jgi:FSR family fosmidomycin resistance protein-like MFS transporter
MKDLAKTNIKVLFALTLVHFTGDFYSSFISPLFPLFVENMGLSLAQVGIISGAARLLAFIVQPSVGYLADRYSTRHFILIGVLMPIVFIPLSGITPGFRTLLLVVVLGSLGSSMFHPSVTGLVPLYAGHQTGFAMSVFNTGGTFAFGIGPLFITWFAGRFGLSALPFTMVLGLMAAWYLYWTVPVPQSEGLRRLGFWGALKDSLGGVWQTIICIWLVMVIRSVTGQSFLTFMSVYYVEKGFSVFSAGVMFSLFTVAGTISGLIAGHVADRIGFKPIFIFAHALMSPMLILFLYLQDQWVYLGAIMAGAFVLATLPLGVAMAQILAPKGRSMVASLMMGFAFGLGGAISPLVGKLADMYSIHSVLMGVSFLPLLSLPLIFTFPRVRSQYS